MGRFHPRRVQSWVRPVCAVGLLVGLVVLAAGCGRGSFVGRQYDDFTAYYNTFHNAQQAFEKGLESVTQSESEIDRGQYISLFPNPQAGSDGSSFEKAIQKSADLLRSHPNSKWVDDALMLIGRSRYYQQNYSGAVQKFREVVALEGEREGEARFRLARTLVAAEQYAEAREALQVGLEQEGDFGTWSARMRLVQGQLFVRQENWEEAEQALSRGLEGSLPDVAGARGAFLLGQVRETLGDLDGARAAYRQVLDYDPTYQLAFAARLAALEMQGRDGDPARALDRLESLERDDNTPEMRGEIARVRARLYREQGRPERARTVLTDVLRSDDAPSGTVEGRVHYDLAALYRDTYEDFGTAAAHFDTAATALPSRSGRRGSGAEPRAQVLPGTPTDAATQAERFQGLAQHARTVARIDSLLRLGRMPPSEFQEAVERIRERRRKQQQQEAARSRQRNRQRFGGGMRTDGRRDQSAQAQQNAVQTRGSDAGFLFHRDPALVQQGRRQFRQTWGDRPLVDNWRRVNAIQSSATADAGDEDAQGGSPSGTQASQKRLVDLSVVPRDSASQAQMEKNRAVARYRLANALYRDAARPDSAETWYLLILGEDREHPVAKQALYGLAQAHRAQGDTAAAREAYHYIVQEYPGTPYADRAREQLGLEPVESAAAPDSATQADSAYARAYTAWQSGGHDVALKEFLAVAKTYPRTPTASRALLAAGVVYHRSVRRDTSSRLRTQFARYVDSLAQSNASDGSTGKADTTTGSRPASASPRRASPDTARASDGPQRAADTTARRRRPPRRTPQSDTTTADTTNVRTPVPDSLARDSVREADSTGVPRALRSPRRPDSTTSETPASPRDTTIQSEPRATADSVTTAPDSSRQAAGRKNSPDPLEGLLTYLTEQYSDTPAAKRAQKLLEYLKQQRAAADSAAADTSRSTALSRAMSSDTTGATVSDSARAAADDPQAPTAAPDSVTGPRQAGPDTTRTAEAPADTSGRRPARPADNLPERTPDRDSARAKGQWAVVVSSQETQPAAEDIASKYEDRFDPVQVVSATIDGTRQFRVTVGRYDSMAAAERVLDRRDADLPDNAWVLKLR